MGSVDPRLNLRAAASKLRIFCPTNYPVRVSRPEMADWADTKLVKRGQLYYRIRIRKGVPAVWAVHLLVHEWPHAMTWPIHHGRHPLHGPYFGIAYSECYMAIYDDET